MEVKIRAGRNGQVVQLTLHGGTGGVSEPQAREAAGRINAWIAYANTVLMRTPKDQDGGEADPPVHSTTGRVKP